METVTYKKGYKYQLVEAYQLKIRIHPEEAIVTDYIELDTNGMITLKKGYAWDGPSGPTIDTLNFMRGSLVHDALYQLMRHSKLDAEKHRLPADELLRDICREDGMSWFRSLYVYQAVRLFGELSADEDFRKPRYQAPEPGELPLPSLDTV